MESFGFTLIEILAVLSVFGFLGVWSYNGINNVLEYLSLYNSAVLLANDIKECQNVSMQEGVTSKIILDMSGEKNKYYLVKVEKSPKVYRTVFLIKDVNLGWTSFNNYKIEFDPIGCPDMSDIGTPDKGGTVALKSKDRWMYVIVTPVTGHVRISEMPP
jgi:prepilin-type N-terminal cleavage/methylation domain-containing protein